MFKLFKNYFKFKRKKNTNNDVALRILGTDRKYFIV